MSSPARVCKQQAHNLEGGRGRQSAGLGERAQRRRLATSATVNAANAANTIARSRDCAPWVVPWAPSHMLAWQAADGEAQQRTRREAHVRGGGEDVCGDFAQPCAPWRASSAGDGIFFEVQHSSGLFSRQGTPLFEDTCEARGERSVGGRGQSDGAICGCASSRSACHRLWARGAWPRARLCCACCRDGGLLRTDGPVSSHGGCHVTLLVSVRHRFASLCVGGSDARAQKLPVFKNGKWTPE